MANTNGNPYLPELATVLEVVEETILNKLNEMQVVENVQIIYPATNRMDFFRESLDEIWMRR